MNDDEHLEVPPNLDTEADARRDFLRKVGRASAAAPAVALLMAANLKPANAQSAYGGGATTCPDGQVLNSSGECVSGGSGSS